MEYVKSILFHKYGPTNKQYINQSRKSESLNSLGTAWYGYVQLETRVYPDAVRILWYNGFWLKIALGTLHKSYVFLKWKLL